MKVKIRISFKLIGTMSVNYCSLRVAFNLLHVPGSDLWVEWGTVRCTVTFLILSYNLNTSMLDYTQRGFNTNSKESPFRVHLILCLILLCVQ